ncbi:MAG: aspartyl protease family protein [Euryarchaeota archaeon]|nr:aspartyl protease family protein [Euryarchaeota archaeon]
MEVAPLRNMGETTTLIKIYGESDFIQVEALVDTGATFTKLSSSIAKKLGLKVQYETTVELSDGRLVKRGLALAEVEIEGVRRPMLIAISEERPLVGYTTLEILGFKINPITRKLEKSFAIEY